MALLGAGGGGGGNLAMLRALPGEIGEATRAKTSSWPSWDCGHPFPVCDPTLSCSWAGGPCRHGDPKANQGSGEGSGPHSPQPPILLGMRSRLSRYHTPATEPRHPCHGMGRAGGDLLPLGDRAELLPADSAA